VPAVAFASALALSVAVYSAPQALSPVAGGGRGGSSPGATGNSSGIPAADPTSAPTRTPGTDRNTARRERPTTTVRGGVTCTFPRTAAASAQARRIQDVVGPAAVRAGRHVAVGVEDLVTGTRCSLRGARRFDSASIVKVAVVAAAVRDARLQRRSLTAQERAWSRAAITVSDNDATSALWRRIGAGAGLKRFLAAAGMRRTVPGDGPRWGLTRVTADDQLVLLRHVSTHGVLTKAERAYILGLMRSVTPSQRWGVPTGAPAGTTVGNKNGWLPRATAAWRVHSIGTATGPGRSYTAALLSDNDATFAAGIARMDALARAVHRALS